MALSLKRAVSIAHERAEKIDPNNREGVAWDAEVFVGGVFSTFLGRGKSIEHWTHVDRGGLFTRAGAFSINREELKALTASYIEEMQWLHDRSIDWMLADMLAYAELDAFLLASNKHLHFNYSTKALLGSLAVRAFWSLIKWCAWIAIVIAAFVVSKWLGGVAVVLTVVFQASEYIRRRKLRLLTESMIDAYTALSSSTLSWSVVWDLLKKSRDMGAVWDPELYRLVELRMQAKAG